MNNSEGQTQEPVGGMKNEWQLCPKCNGQGSVSKPPWVPGDVHQWSSTSVTYPCDVCNGTKIIACLFTPPPAPIKTEGEDEKNPLFKMWDNDEVPDLTSATNEQKDKLINGLLEISAKEFLKMFMALGLSSHIETKVINYANGEEFMFSFKKIAPPSPVGIGGCDCVNVEFGSYDNQIEVVPPPHMVEYYTKQGGSKTICLDACVAVEVCNLWKLGITTTGCCCGHNKGEGFIGVIEDDIARMKEMGYRVAYNKSRPEDEDSFIPKSTKLIP